MSHSNYDLIKDLSTKQQELNELISSLRGRFTKKFQYDASTLRTLSDGTNVNVYELIKNKLGELRDLKHKLNSDLPEIQTMLSIGVGPGSRFDQWLDKQKKHRDHHEFLILREELITPIPTVTPSSDPIKTYSRSFQTCYSQLELVKLYLQRMQQSTNISNDDKKIIASFTEDIDTLMSQIKGLNINESQDLERILKLKKFGDFFQNSVMMADKFKYIIHPKIEEILSRSKDFSWHFSPTQKTDADNLNTLILNIRVLPQFHRILGQSLGAEDPLKTLIEDNQRIIDGQQIMIRRLNKADATPLLEELLNLETEIPTHSAYKSMPSSKRSGIMEVMLNALNPERFHPSPRDAFIIKDCLSLALGHSRQFGFVNPQEFLGEHLLKKGPIDPLFYALAAISPVKSIKIEASTMSDTYTYTAEQKIKAYTCLIQAIHEGKLKLNSSPILDQKRLLAERMLYLMTKYRIPKNNPDVQIVSDLIASGSGAKLSKAVGGLFTKKEDKTVETKTIQKLFREYDETKPYELTQLAQRFKGQGDTEYLSSTSESELSVTPSSEEAESPIAHGAGAPTVPPRRKAQRNLENVERRPLPALPLNRSIPKDVHTPEPMSTIATQPEVVRTQGTDILSQIQTFRKNTLRHVVNTTKPKNPAAWIGPLNVIIPETDDDDDDDDDNQWTPPSEKPKN